MHFKNGVNILSYMTFNKFKEVKLKKKKKEEMFILMQFETT